MSRLSPVMDLSQYTLQMELSNTDCRSYLQYGIGGPLGSAYWMGNSDATMSMMVLSYRKKCTCYSFSRNFIHLLLLCEVQPRTGHEGPTGE